MWSVVKDILAIINVQLSQVSFSFILNFNEGDRMLFVNVVSWWITSLFNSIAKVSFAISKTTAITTTPFLLITFYFLIHFFISFNFYRFVLQRIKNHYYKFAELFVNH